MSQNIAHNPHGKRVRVVKLEEPDFPIPPATVDETRPTGRVIRRPEPKRPFTAQDAIDVIRRLAMEARA